MTKQINGDKLFVIDHHPAIPPSDQLKKWEDQWFDEEEHPDVLLIQAFQAGADQELEAVIEWMKYMGYWGEDGMAIPALRAARRPKPPSLKKQALALLQPGEPRLFNSEMQDTIRRALEQLDD